MAGGDDRYPDQLAASLVSEPKTWLVRLAVKLTRPDARTLRAAAEAVLPAPYNFDPGYIPDLVILVYSPSRREQAQARQRMLRSFVETGSLMFGVARAS